MSSGSDKQLRKGLLALLALAFLTLFSLAEDRKVQKRTAGLSRVGQTDAHYRGRQDIGHGGS